MIQPQSIPVVFIGYSDNGPVYGQIALNNFFNSFNKTPTEKGKLVFEVNARKITTNEDGTLDFMRFAEPNNPHQIKSVLETYWEEEDKEK